MEVPDELLCLFTAPVEEQNDSFVIEIPHEEVTLGEVTDNEIYRIALLPSEANKEPDRDTTAEFDMESRQASQKPPVAEGDRIDVEIEDIGDQGDGIARVGPGYVVI
ncbi:MAG: TRAM domain-containing protein, partial [Halobacteriaceae archaeon]